MALSTAAKDRRRRILAGVVALAIPGFIAGCAARKKHDTTSESISVSGFTMPMSDDQMAESEDGSQLSEVYQSVWRDHAQRFAAAAVVPVSAAGYYEYLANAGFSLSAPAPLDSSDGARHSISF